jgi:hypothetical protein
MQEDVGEADTDSDDQGAFDGLIMALKDIKIYVLMFSLTAYVVGLSFNAFFVSEATCRHSDDTNSAANPYRYPRLQLRTYSAHECSTMGLFRDCLDDQRVARR